MRRARPRSRTHARTGSLAPFLVGLACLGGCGRGPALDPAAADAPLPAPADPVDDALADAGAWTFARECAACHTLGGGPVVGPDLAGVTRRRELGWIEAMIRRPDSMLAGDSSARALLAEYQVPMLDRGLDGARIRALLEFLRRADQGPGAPGDDPDLK